MARKTWKGCGHPRTAATTRGVHPTKPGGSCSVCFRKYQAQRTAERSAARAAARATAAPAERPDSPDEPTTDRPVVEQPVMSFGFVRLGYVRPAREYEYVDEHGRRRFRFDGSLDKASTA